MRSVVIELKAELANFKSLVEQNAYKSFMPSDYEDLNEDLIQEVHERDERKCNIILYNIAEIADETKTNIIAHDKTKIDEVLTYLSVDAEVKNISLLGRFDPAKTTARPIKITFDQESTVYKVLKKAINLKNNTDLRQVNISSDRTPTQITYFKQLKYELDNRRINGEAYLKIKYVQGVPKIITLN